ncbi:helix-turn-helix transcriptional regulator [Streptomyces sp. NPDC047000]|uniref:helix-turn-helix domain-containing protein n=1 Tax=Streptomyces sp. NPDC047000 TaxID=3155474 RepID=UPI0033F3A77D
MSDLYGVLDVGRPEIPIDPGSGPLASLAYELRQLRRRAGDPSYRELARRANYSQSVLSTAASGRKLPSREVTLAYAAACGGDTAEWERRWTATARAMASRPAGGAAGRTAAADQTAAGRTTMSTVLLPSGPPSGPGTDSADPAAPGEPAGPRWLRAPWPWARRRVLAVAGAAVVLAAVTAAVTVRWDAGDGDTAGARGTAKAAVAGRTAGYSVIAAEDCHSGHGWNTNGNPSEQGGASGWFLSEDGGWAGQSCEGLFRYTPGSGTDRPGHDRFLWIFRTGLGKGTTVCTLRLYIPRGDATRVGTEKAYYSVTAGPQKTPLGTFTVDQRARQGQWVDVPGTYSFAADPLIVRLSDRGRTADGIAADAAEVNCRVR